MYSTGTDYLKATEKKLIEELKTAAPAVQLKSAINLIKSGYGEIVAMSGILGLYQQALEASENFKAFTPVNGKMTFIDSGKRINF